MIKSKDIADYFEVKLSELRPGTALPFPVFLYLPQNFHLLVWRAAGEEITEDLIARYLGRGLEKVYVHGGDAEAYRDYMRGESRQQESASPPPEAVTEAVTEAATTRTQEAALIKAVQRSQSFSETQKEAILAEAARQMIADAGRPRDAAEQSRADRKARSVIQEVLQDVGGETASLISEFWKLSNVDPDLEHAINVATYALIFAMAFGRIKSDLLADLAIAGLLHDIGLCEVSASITAQPWRSMAPNSHKAYTTHVEAGVRLIELHAPALPSRVKAIIRQHHEKFDGSGYPAGLQGFQLDDISQILAIADLVDSIASGQWDGLKRSMADTFKTIERLERAKTFPENFNPEIFSAIMRWLKSSGNEALLEDAVETVAEQAKSVVGEQT